VPYVQAHLDAEGIGDSPVRVIEAVRADLDGNGSMETVIVAQDPAIEPMVAPSAGYYSVVLLLRPDGGAVLTSVLENVVFLEDQEFPAFVDFQVQSLTDLNGDGTMEVIIDYTAWEGAGSFAFEATEGSDSELVIANGCGA
jgi:hypothetical protein